MSIYFNSFYKNIDMKPQINEPLGGFKKTNLLSVIYYPFQGILIAPHVEVEIKGRCYALCTGVRDVIQI